MSASEKFWRAAIAPAKICKPGYKVQICSRRISHRHTQDSRQLSRGCASTAQRTLELIDLRAKLAEVVWPTSVHGADVACASSTRYVKRYASQHLQAAKASLSHLNTCRQ